VPDARGCTRWIKIEPSDHHPTETLAALPVLDHFAREHFRDGCGTKPLLSPGITKFNILSGVFLNVNRGRTLLPVPPVPGKTEA
jgi:hypothetical protein